jgi:hypothetical protein
MPGNTHSMLDAYRFSLVRQLGRTVLAVVLLEIVGLLLAFAVGQILSLAFGIQQSSPLSIVLLVDFSIIAFGAVLAEIAAPSLMAKTSFDELISWSLTTLSIAITTLAPVAAYAAEITSRSPEQFKDRINVLILILHPDGDWDAGNLFIYRAIVLGVVIADLAIATFAANRLGNIAIAAHQTGSAAEQSLHPKGPYPVLFVSICLFCSYILFMHEWSRSSVVLGPKAPDLTPLLIWSFILIFGLSIIAIIIVGFVKGFSRAVRSRWDGHIDGTQSEKESVFGDLQLTIVAALVGFLVWKLVTDSAFAAATIARVKAFVLMTGAPEEFANKIEELLRKTLDLVSSDLTGLFYLIGGTLAFFLALAAFIAAIATIRKLWLGVVVFLKSIPPIILRPVTREGSSEDTNAKKSSEDDRKSKTFFYRLGLLAAGLLIVALIVVESSPPLRNASGRLWQWVTEQYPLVLVTLRDWEQHLPWPKSGGAPTESRPEVVTAAPPTESRPEVVTAAPPTESRPEVVTAAPPTESRPEVVTAAPPTDSKPQELPRQEPKMVFDVAPVTCGERPPTSWPFRNVKRVKSEADSSPIVSCRITSVACQESAIVGVGLASTKGTDSDENVRALQRGINLVFALKDDWQKRCNGKSISTYVLDLGRYSDDQKKDKPDQRKVIAFIGTGSGNVDEAVATALAIYEKSDPKVTHYTVRQLCKLDHADRQRLVQNLDQICVALSSGAVSLR